MAAGIGELQAAIRELRTEVQSKSSSSSTTAGGDMKEILEAIGVLKADMESTKAAVELNEALADSKCDAIKKETQHIGNNSGNRMNIHHRFRCQRKRSCSKQQWI